MSSLYTNLFLKKKGGNKLLILIAFLLILFAIGVLYFLPLSGKGRTLQTFNIEFVTLSNLSPSQVSIIWKTRERKNSYILFGDSPGKLVREAEDELKVIFNKSGFYHYSNLNGLQPNKTYYFAIKIGNKLVGKGGLPFKVKTPPRFLPSQNSPLIGKIINKKGMPEKGKIVILQIEGAFPLSAITGDKGEWVIPLGLVFDKEGKNKIEISKKEKFELRVLGRDLIVKGNLESFMEYEFPLEIGKEYFFEKSQNKITNLKKIAKNKQFKILLIYPKQGMTISNARPLIKGKGIPYKEVIIEIESDRRIVLKTVVDEKGNWYVSLPFKLNPGRHIINVFTKDYQDKPVKITRDFYIAKGGESVLSVATSSANLTITPELTLTPTTNLTQSPTSTPIPSPTKIIIPTSTPTPPVSGFNSNIFLIFSFLFLVPGLFLLFK